MTIGKIVGYGILGYILFLAFYATSQGLMMVIFVGFLKIGIRLSETLINYLCISLAVASAAGIIFLIHKTPKYVTKKMNLERAAETQNDNLESDAST